MAVEHPKTELDARYGDEGAPATPWSEGHRALEDAQLYWITTIRPEGRPHMTPLLAVWHGDAIYVCTGPEERKARNLEHNGQVIVSTGTNALAGLDVVVEGEAERITDEGLLRELADAWVAKYGEDWRFEVRDGAFQHGAGSALVFRVAPATVYGFGKEPYSQTRWSFAAT